MRGKEKSNIEEKNIVIKIKEKKERKRIVRMKRYGERIEMIVIGGKEGMKRRGEGIEGNEGKFREWDLIRKRKIEKSLVVE